MIYVFNEGEIVEAGKYGNFKYFIFFFYWKYFQIYIKLR